MSEETEVLDQPEEVEQTEEEQAAEYDKVFYGEEEQEEETEVEPEEETTEEETEEPEEPEEETEETEETDPEESEEKPEEAEEEKPEEKLLTLKWKGKEIQVTQEEAIAMAQQNFDATHKYQEVAKLRKSTESDLDLLKRAREGDKQALATIMQQGEIDPVDLLDVETVEQGTAEQAEPFLSPQVESMIEEVSQDEELFKNLQDIEQDLPQPVIDKMAKDPEIFYAIVNEVRSGDASVIMPIVQKEIAKMPNLDRSVVMNDIDAFASLYINVKNSMTRKQPETEEQPESKPQKKKANMNEIAVNKSGGTERKSAKASDPYVDDAAYQAILDRLEGQ